MMLPNVWEVVPMMCSVGGNSTTVIAFVATDIGQGGRFAPPAVYGSVGCKNANGSIRAIKEICGKKPMEYHPIINEET